MFYQNPSLFSNNKKLVRMNYLFWKYIEIIEKEGGRGRFFSWGFLFYSPQTCPTKQAGFKEFHSVF